MEEHFKHIKSELLSTVENGATSFCGEQIKNEFHFLSTDHAVFTRQNKGRFLPCPYCKAVIIKALNSEG